MKLIVPGHIVLIIFLLQSVTPVAAQNEVKPAIFPDQDPAALASLSREFNEHCFHCHGSKTLEHKYDTMDNQARPLIAPEMVFDRDRFYRSNHKSFRCTDCHSKEFAKYPHATELKKEELPACLECHGFDEKYAKYHFEDIESEYQASVHFGIRKKTFTCWTCHDPHYYKVSRPDSSDLKQIILSDNAICLNCHDNYKRFMQYSDTERMSISKAHKWLPDRITHFRNVRCIDCHSEINTRARVPHLVTSKEKAIKDCNKCHSENSMLKTFYRSDSGRMPQNGFNNMEMTKYTYVIGTGRNNFLNMISIIVIGLLIGAIGIHLIARIIYRHKI